MDIVILADFSGSFDGRTNNRFMYLANMLSEEHSVELVTSDFHHGSKTHFAKTPEDYPFKVTMLHEAQYKKNISLKRFYSHFVWGSEVKKYLKKRKKPDVIYCAVPTLYASYNAAKYCKKNGVKFIVDIQDLWPEAFKMVLRIPVVSDIIFAPFTFLANGIYKRADEVVAVSDTYVNRAQRVNKKGNNGHTVYLGTRLETYDGGASQAPLYTKPEGEMWIGYCGTLGASYDIPNLIYAIKQLGEKGISNLKLIVMGDGARRADFEAIAEQSGINCLFTGRLPYGDMCAQLTQCDIVVNPIKRGSAASIINKHADYAASGLPVVNSQESREYRELIERYNMGLNCKNEDANDMADKLEMLVANRELRIEMGKNARRCAEERFDRKNSYKEIADAIVG
ncbi:MAG: glycosyltransferase family 4 protein [Clostridia bacterium]|nr:glycosyltransferase family 4 protein [Clostridia bacterium]